MGEDNSLLCLREFSSRGLHRPILRKVDLCETEKYAWFDARTVEDRLDHVARARGTTNLGKFRTSCKEMIATNSKGAALQKAYQQMRAGVGTIKTETS